MLQLAPGTAALVDPVGFPGNPALVMPVTGDFTVNFEFEVDGESVSQYFNSFNGGPAGFEADNQSAFYYTPPVAPTPEPGSMLLFGTGLLLVGGFLRRRLAQPGVLGCEIA